MGVISIVVGNMIPNGTYQIRNMYSKKYMDVEGPSKAEGAYIQQWAHHVGNQSKWQFSYVGNGYYTIKSVYSNRYVAVADGSTANHAPIIQTATVSDACRWRIELTDRYTLKFISKSSGKALTLSSVSSSNGVNLEQATYSNNLIYTDEWYHL